VGRRTTSRLRWVAATTEISNVVFDNVDIDALVTRTLDALADRGVPSQVTALAGPMADGIRSFVTNAIGDIVASERFEHAWVEASGWRTPSCKRH
jgi:hypothetical protein